MTDVPRKEYVNIYGRKGGRGVRPCLIVLKLVCVSAFLGGLMMLLALTLTTAQPRSQEEWQRRADLISRAYRWRSSPVLPAPRLSAALLAPIWACDHSDALVRPQSHPDLSVHALLHCS